MQITCNCDIIIYMKTMQAQEILEQNNLRKTSGMLTVLTSFLNTQKPITAEDIFEQNISNLNLSTVYRCIQRLKDHDIINEVNLSSERRYFELANRKHHHHLTCTSCETIVDIPCATNIIKRISPSKYKFNSIENHSLELFGVCNKCS